MINNFGRYADDSVIMAALQVRRIIHKKVKQSARPGFFMNIFKTRTISDHIDQGRNVVADMKKLSFFEMYFFVLMIKFLCTQKITI